MRHDHQRTLTNKVSSLHTFHGVREYRECVTRLKEIYSFSSACYGRYSVQRPAYGKHSPQWPVSKTFFTRCIASLSFSIISSATASLSTPLAAVLGSLLSYHPLSDLLNMSLVQNGLQILLSHSPHTFAMEEAKKWKALINSGAAHFVCENGFFAPWRIPVWEITFAAVSTAISLLSQEYWKHWRTHAVAVSRR